jgi:hypothetical protein
MPKCRRSSHWQSWRDAVHSALVICSPLQRKRHMLSGSIHGSAQIMVVRRGLRCVKHFGAPLPNAWADEYAGPRY